MNLKIQVVTVLLLTALFLTVLPAHAMEPGTGTPMGVASPDNHQGYPGHPHGGYYWIRSAFNPTDLELQQFGPPIWRLKHSSLPPGAKDNTFFVGVSNAFLVPLPPYPGKHCNGAWFAKLKSNGAGWLKVELVWRNVVVDAAWYRFYKVNLLEDDEPQKNATYFGYDPRFGAKGVGAKFPEEGGNYWLPGDRPEVPAEEHRNFHDKYAGLPEA